MGRVDSAGAWNLRKNLPDFENVSGILSGHRVEGHELNSKVVNGFQNINEGGKTLQFDGLKLVRLTYERLPELFGQFMADE